MFGFVIGGFYPPAPPQWGTRASPKPPAHVGFICLKELANLGFQGKGETG